MSKSSLIVITGLLAFNLSSRAQFFERIYPGLNLQSIGAVENTIDGGYLICGANDGGFLFKLDASGDPLWSRTDTALLRQANGVIQDASGNIVVCGSGNSQPYSSVAVVSRYDSLGLLLSNQFIAPTDGWGTWGTGIARSPDRLTSHYFYYTDGFTADNYFLLDNGDVLAGDNSRLTGNSVRISDNGDYCSSANLAFDMDSLFNWRNNVLVLGRNNYPRTQYFFDTDAVANALSPDGSILIAGTYDSLGGKLVRMLKLDASEHLVWDHFLADPSIVSVDAIDVAPDGGFVLLCGRFDGANHLALLHTDASGQMLWMRKFYGNGSCIPVDLNVLPDGFLILGNCGNDPYLIRTDILGQIQATGVRSAESPLISAIIFPNPSSGTVKLNLTGTTAENVTVIVLDQLGRNVFSSILAKPEQQLDLSWLLRGVYHFQVLVNGEQLKCGKFVIE